jgi:hypothetical protein
MLSAKLSIAVSLAIVLLATFSAPIFAVQYNPGVSVGQYVKYGVTETSETENTLAWYEKEVTAVSGTEVTIHHTGQFKNGTASPERNSILDVAAGTLNGTPTTLLPVQAANLNEGDAIPPPNTYRINKTETRTYLGVGRSVNIVNTTSSTADYNMSLLVVLDKASGFMLEMEIETTQNKPAPTTSKTSNIVVETNIFASPSPEATIIGLPADYFYAIAAIVIIAIIAAVAIMLRKRKL